ncbi:hypothetical protein Tco_0280573 [Tanacetum coccineum]
MVSGFKTLPVTDSGARLWLANLQLISALEMWDEHPLAESCVPKFVKIARKIKYEIEFGSYRQRVTVPVAVWSVGFRSGLSGKTGGSVWSGFDGEDDGDTNTVAGCRRHVREISLEYGEKQRAVSSGLNKDDRTKFDIEKFNEKNDFRLWQVRMKALLEQQGLAAALEELHAATIVAYNNVIQKKAYDSLILRLGNSQSEHIDEFPKLVGDLATIDTVISDEDQALILLTSLPSSYDNFVETLLYGWDTLKLEDMLPTLNSKELQKMTKAKGDGGEGLYVRGRSGQRDMKQDKDSRGSYHMTYMRDYLVDFEEYDDGNVLLDDGRECRVHGTGKPGLSKVFLAEDTVMSKYLVNRSPLSAIKFKTPIDMLRFFGWLASIKQGVLEPGKFKCIFLGYHEGIVDNKLSRLDDVTSKVVLYRNLGLNKSGEYKNTFIGSGVGTDSVHYMVALLKTKAGCMTFTYAWKEEAICHGGFHYGGAPLDCVRMAWGSFVGDDGFTAFVHL